MNAIASILAHTVGHASLHIPLSDRHLSYILFYSKLLNIVPWKQCIWRHSVLYWCIVRHTTFYLDKHCKHLAAALSWKRPKYSTFSIYIYTYVFHRTTIYVHISATSILDATGFCANHWQGRRAYSRLTFTYYHICDIFQLLFLLCPFASTVEQDLWHNHFTNKNIGSELDQLWMWNNIKWLPCTYHDISIYAAMNCTF